MKTNLIIFLCLIALAVCQFNLESYNKTEGRGKGEGRPFGNHSKEGRNRTGGRYGWRGENRPPRHDKERRNRLFSNEGNSYFGDSDNNSTNHEDRPHRRRDFKNQNGFNLVHSFMYKAVNFYPDAFGAKIVNNYALFYVVFVGREERDIFGEKCKV